MKNLGVLLLSASAVAYLWASSYHVFMIFSPSAVLVMITFLLTILILVTRGNVYIDRNFSSLLIVSFCLLLWATVVLTINGFGLQKRLFKILMSLGVCFMTYTLLDSYRSLKFFINILIIGGFLSAIVAIGQFLVGPPFIDVWINLHPLTYEFALKSVLGGRVAGLSTNPISLSYQMATLVPLAVALIFGERKGLGKVKRFLLLLAISAMVLGLILTQVRSATLGTFLGTGFAVLLIRGKTKKWAGPLVAGIVISGVLYFVTGWTFAELRLRYLQLEDVSARSRIPMQLTALRYALRHPLGTGNYLIKEESVDIVASDDPDVVETIVESTTHNQLLNVLVYYGFPGFAMVFAFYWIIVRRLKMLWKLVSKFDVVEYKWLPAGVCGSMLAYLVNSMFHNAGPFSPDIFNWYIIGIIFATYKVIARGLIEDVLHWHKREVVFGNYRNSMPLTRFTLGA